MKRWSILCAAALTLGMVSSSEALAYVARRSATIGANLSPSAQESVKKSIDGQLAAADKAEGRPSNALATDCLFAAEMVKQGDKRFTPYLQARVDALLKLAAQDENGSLTWSRRKQDNDPKRCSNGGFDAFGDGTCDAPGTPYAFQSGLALACLGRAADVLKKPDLLRLGSGGVSYWSKHAAILPACGNCVYFWSSGNANDSIRFIRNTNIYLSLGTAAVAQTDRDWMLVKRSIASETFERRNGNQGYLSALDPEWQQKPTERARTENHMAGMAAALLAIHNLRGDPEALDLARWNYKTWAGCNSSDCASNNCSFWSGNPTQCRTSTTFVHCTFRQVDPAAKGLCELAISKGSTLTSSDLLFVVSGD
ncbi:hypothetical protein [Microvirga alba]|uniref:Uncharacterized protein n=1 Tax=Microvirga alba TaxID=2791025 RepID=A0A931BUI8_9HYPH|nr:hypothetical protein [Microvirga alba]MBF9234989.1 hypothetical protein [Microvirga alba]